MIKISKTGVKVMGGKCYFLDCMLKIAHRNERSILQNFEKKYRACTLSYTFKAEKNRALELLMKVSLHYFKVFCYAGLLFS